MNRWAFQFRGWNFTHEYNGTETYEKGDVYKDDNGGAYMSYNAVTGRLIIQSTDKGFNSDGPLMTPKFNGQISKIQDFDKIEKWTGTNLIKPKPIGQ